MRSDSSRHEEPTVWADGGVRPLSNWMTKATNLHTWEGYILRTYDRVLRLPIHPLTNRSQRMAVIVEPRRHPHLEYVVHNVMHFLGAGWGLAIFHGTANVDQVRHLAAKMPGDPPMLVNVGMADLPIPEYNKLLTSVSRFWGVIPAETVLIFQTDSLLRHPFDITRYPQGCHYIGAPWPTDRRPLGLPFGNGGFSLRSRKAMIRILEHYPRDPEDPSALPEDVHFSFHVRRYTDAVVPSLEQATLFSTEHAFVCDSDAVHPNLYELPNTDLVRLLEEIRYPPDDDGVGADGSVNRNGDHADRHNHDHHRDHDHHHHPNSQYHPHPTAPQHGTVGPTRHDVVHELRGPTGAAAAVPTEATAHSQVMDVAQRMVLGVGECVPAWIYGGPIPFDPAIIGRIPPAAVVGGEGIPPRAGKSAPVQLPDYLMWMVAQPVCGVSGYNLGSLRGTRGVDSQPSFSQPEGRDGRCHEAAAGVGESGGNDAKARSDNTLGPGGDGSGLEKAGGTGDRHKGDTEGAA